MSDCTQLVLVIFGGVFAGLAALWFFGIRPEMRDLEEHLRRLLDRDG